MVRIAEMYYLESKLQQEIADTIHTSRSNVARYLKMCVEEGVVEFKIKKMSSNLLQVQSRLESRFRLQKAVIVPSSGTPDQVKGNIGTAGAECLENVVRDGMLIGTAWGTTLYQMAVRFRPAKRVHADTIQFVGGVDPRYSDTDGQEIIRRLQSNFDGNGYLLQAPMIVGSRDLKEMLLQEPDIKAHFAKFERTDVALIGIGLNRYSQSAVYRAGHISKKEADEMVRRGAIGDICGTPIDMEGRVCKTSVSGRVIGIDTDVLRRIPTRIGVSCGIEKADAILGALRGGFVNILVTDEETGMRVLEQS